MGQVDLVSFGSYLRGAEMLEDEEMKVGDDCPHSPWPAGSPLSSLSTIAMTFRVPPCLAV